MMKSNMAMFNEELGELTFAILARSVLADHTRDDFAHMDRLFRLLRVYRDVKGDVVADTSGAANSLNWRHKINKVGEEVVSTELFFKKIIRQMVSGTYLSYDGTAKSYTNATNAATLKVRPTSPLVYMPKDVLDEYLQNLMAVIRVDMNTNFLYAYKHIWPECINHDDEHDDDEQVVQMDHVEENHDGEFESDDQNEQENKQDPKEGLDAKHNEEDVNAVVEDDDGPRLDADHAVQPLHPKSWGAWGRLNDENVMSGKRKPVAIERFGYGGRRVNGRFPQPNM